MFEHVDSDVHADSRDSEEMAMKTAEKLLKVHAENSAESTPDFLECEDIDRMVPSLSSKF